MADMGPKDTPETLRLSSLALRASNRRRRKTPEARREAQRRAMELWRQNAKAPPDPPMRRYDWDRTRPRAKHKRRALWAGGPDKSPTGSCLGGDPLRQVVRMGQSGTED